MKHENFAIAVCLIVIFAGIGILTVVYSPPEEPLLSTVGGVYKWNGNSTDLTIVYSWGNESISVVHGGTFTVNGSASIYENNNLLANTP